MEVREWEEVEDWEVEAWDGVNGVAVGVLG
jgi:hypothetical protein